MSRRSARAAVGVWPRAERRADVALMLAIALACAAALWLSWRAL